METKEIANSIIMNQTKNGKLLTNKFVIYFHVRDDENNIVRLNKQMANIDNLESTIDAIKRQAHNLICFWEEPEAKELNDKWEVAYKKIMRV